MQCKKHPTYKAIRKPTADCQTCREMYQMIQEQMQEDIERMENEGPIQK